MNRVFTRIQSPDRRALSWERIGYIAIFCAYALVRCSLLQPARNNIWTDTQDYLRMSGWPLTSLAFWAGSRPVGILLVYKLLGSNIQAIIYFQLLFAICCWALLGAALAGRIGTPWLRTVAFAGVLMFSLSSDIAQWDLIVLSESLTASLFALLIALGLWVLAAYQAPASRRRRALLLAGLLAGALLWSLTRDANAYLVLGLAGLLAPLLLIPRVWRSAYCWPLIIVALGFGAIFLLQSASAEVYGRWRYPLINILGKRILVDEQSTAFFAAHGMPTDEKVMRYQGDYGHAHGNAILRDDDMEYFRSWMSERGKSTYMLFLASRPLETLGAPLQNIKSLLRPPVGYYGEKAELSFPDWLIDLSAIVYPRPIELLLWGIGLTLLIAAGLALRGWAQPAWLIPLLLLLLVYPMMLLVWHGDTMELGRHSFLVAVQVRLAGWLLLLLVSDALLLGLRGWRAARAPAPASGTRRADDML